MDAIIPKVVLYLFIIMPPNMADKQFKLEMPSGVTADECWADAKKFREREPTSLDRNAVMLRSGCIADGEHTGGKS